MCPAAGGDHAPSGAGAPQHSVAGCVPVDFASGASGPRGLAGGALGVAYVRLMSIEKPLREMVQAELRARLAPMHQAIERMDARLEVIGELVDVLHRLGPLTKRMQSLQLALPGVTTPVVPRGETRRAEPPRARSETSRESAAPRPPAQDPVTEALLKAVRESAAAVAVPGAVRPRAPPAMTWWCRRSQDGPAAARSSGCTRPSRSKGYCSAHYQKLRLLVKTRPPPVRLGG